MAARKHPGAGPEDVDEICRGLPETWFGTSWGDVPTWLVPLRQKGDKGDKAALVDANGPFFTIDHFRGFNAVLVQQSRLGEITREELAEVVTDAWLATAPKKLVREFVS